MTRADVKCFPYMNAGRPIFSLKPKFPEKLNRWMGRSLVGRYRPFTVHRYLYTLGKFIDHNDIDIILMNERFASYVGEKHIKEIAHVKKIMYLFDPIRNDNLMKFMELNYFDGIFYENPLWKEDMIFDSPIYHLVPWSVDTRIFRDYSNEYEYDVISSGVISKHYPMRSKLKRNLMANDEINFKYMDYPIFNAIIGRNEINYEYFIKYAKLLSSAKILVFFNGIKGRTVAKYVEGLASRCLMLAPEPLGAKAYHLIPGKNFVDINNANFLEKIEYYLENDEEGRRIAERGIKDAKKYLDVGTSVDGVMKTLEGIM